MKNTKRFSVKIWIDGSSITNPGPGGWAAVLVSNGKARLLGGHVQMATNNQMETKALEEALRALKTPCDVTLYTDSQYVILGVHKLLLGQFPNTNLEFWKGAHQVIGLHMIKIEKTRAHETDPWNNLVDMVAYQCASLSLDYNELYEDAQELLAKSRKR